MKTSRRMARMSRNRKGIPKLNLTSLIDVFTILVFFLLVNSGSSEILQPPKQITLPDSIAESKPRETVVIFIGTEEVLIGEAVNETGQAATGAEALAIRILRAPDDAETLRRFGNALPDALPRRRGYRHRTARRGKGNGRGTGVR